MNLSKTDKWSRQKALGVCERLLLSLTSFALSLPSSRYITHKHSFLEFTYVTLQHMLIFLSSLMYYEGDESALGLQRKTKMRINFLFSWCQKQLDI